MLKSVPNFRDVARFVPALRKGIIYRSDFVTGLDEADEARLAAFGIDWVADLRSPAERADQPNHALRTTGAEIACFDIAGQANPTELAAAFAAVRGNEAARALMQGVYRAFALGALDALGRIVDRLEKADRPILIHCAAGKDRTGFVVASLLTALGVPESEVHCDYLASEGRIHPRILHSSREAMEQIFRDGMDDETLAVINGADRSFLEAAMNAAKLSHGSFDLYLQAAGIDAKRKAVLRQRLLV